MAPYRDRAGKTLTDYPRPSVAVDTAVLTVSEDRLAVVLVDQEGEARLPGTFLHEGETLHDAVLRSLREKAEIEGLRPRQLRVFDAPGRDDRGWVLSVAHMDTVPAERLPHALLCPLDTLPELRYDHTDIVDAAVEALRAEYRRAPDPSGLLEGPFTLRRLRTVHGVVQGERLLPDSFRRAMLPMLTPTGETWSEGRGRPAELYVRAERR